MDSHFDILMNYELQALLEALRRDLRSEQEKVATDFAWSDVHARNVRIVKRLLEAINPKQAREHPTQMRVDPDVEICIEKMIMSIS